MQHWFAPRGYVGRSSRLVLLFAVSMASTAMAETTWQRLDDELGKLLAPELGQALRELENEASNLYLEPLPVRAMEGDETGELVFSLSLNRAAEQPVTVDYATRGGSAQADIDFGRVSGTLEFAVGQQVAEIRVPLLGDTFIEPDESFSLLLSEPQGAFLRNESVAGVIINDDMPQVAIQGGSVLEGNEGEQPLRFRVFLSEAAYSVTRINYLCVDGGANGESDYQPLEGSLEFTPGEIEKYISITVHGDNTIERDEQFAVVLRDPSYLSMGVDSAIGTIVNDDYPSFRVSSPRQVEGNEPRSTLRFSVSLSHETLADLQLRYRTRAGSATPHEDYLPVEGVLEFGPGELKKEIEVPILGDRVIEYDEQFRLELKGEFPGGMLSSRATLLNDDLPVMRVADSQAEEGDSGLTQGVIEVTLSEPYFDPITVNFRSENISAQAGSDYQAVEGRLLFAPGETVQRVQVPIMGDDIPEGREQLGLHLFDLSGGVHMGRARAQLTILDDQDRVIPGAATLEGPAMVRLDALGEPLNGEPPDFSARPWQCVEDRLTGLIWEVKQSTTGLHHADNLYSYYSTRESQSQGLMGGGHCSAPERCDSEAFRDAVNQEGWCGWSDWRLPTRAEIETLILPEVSYPQPTIDSAFFPGTRSSWYWTRSDDEHYRNAIWSVDFSSGNLSISRPLSTPQHVRLVRGKTSVGR